MLPYVFLQIPFNKQLRKKILHLISLYRKIMKFSKIFNHKFLLHCCNLLFLSCGIVLVFGGFYLFSNTEEILLSRLLAATSQQLNDMPQPLFYYISLGLAAAGTIAILAAIIGFWTSCLSTYCFLSLYFLIVIILLLTESAACLAITLWPHCLGLNLDESKMVKALQGNYGVPGREQFTIAMDLAQTKFRCCGMNSEINYDTSLWRLQSYGQSDWAVPLTCCVLSNQEENKLVHLDPKPVNTSQCQTLNKFEFEKARHTDPCLNHLDVWYREHYVFFLGASLIIAIVEFCVLLTIILNCNRISKKRATWKTRRFMEVQSATTRPNLNQTQMENIYEDDIQLPTNKIIMPKVNEYSSKKRKIFVQPPELFKNPHGISFKPSSSRSSHYHISNSYLV